MNTRSTFLVSLLATSILSSDTSTGVPTAVDLANYFPVGKREVKFVVALIASTTLGELATVTIQENDSTTTTSFTTLQNYLGSSAIIASTANGRAITEHHFIVTKRYIRALLTGSTSTGGTVGAAVAVLPFVRVA